MNISLPDTTEHMTFSPPLPADKVELYKRMPMAAMIKVIVTYDQVRLVSLFIFTYSTFAV